jgi:hypothetical protein
LDWIACALTLHLRVTQQEDWYNIKMEDIKDYGGRAIFRYHGDSSITALRTVYPGSYESLRVLLTGDGM